MNALFRDNSTLSKMWNVSTFKFRPGLDTYPEYRASIVIWKVVPPILILLGTAGNILSILVLTRKAIRTSTTALYLTVLAFSDLTVLFTGLFRQWMVFCFGIYVRDVSEVGCKINVWLVYSSLDFSAWILIILTLERVISVWLPHRAKGVCTQFSAVVCLASVGMFVLLLNSHVLYGFGFVHTGEDIDKCRIDNKDYLIFFSKTWPWIDLCAYCVIPFFVIVVGNAVILAKIVKRRNMGRSRVSVTPRNRPLSGKHSYLTVILITLNTFFLVSTTPVSIYNIGFAYWADTKNVQTMAKLDLWWAIVNMFMYSNNTFNFLLYCLSGAKFRQEVTRMFSREKPATNTTTIQLSNLRRPDNDCADLSPTTTRSKLLV